MGGVHVGGLARGSPTRHANFREFMREMHREFHRLRVPATDEGQPEFVNDTTRETDALVEEARLDALRGDWEKAVRALDEAKAYGRPRAEGLGDQIRRLLGRTHMVYFRGLATDPRYAPELLPPLVGELAAQSYRDDSTLEYDLRGGDEELLSRAYATLEQVRNGTYRYAPDGPFGEAVERARESARWGDTDEAWRTLIGALPLWEPLGPDHLAPLAWVADPLLGPCSPRSAGGNCCPRRGADSGVRCRRRRTGRTLTAWRGSRSRTRATSARPTGSSWWRASGRRICQGASARRAPH